MLRMNEKIRQKSVEFIDPNERISSSLITTISNQLNTADFKTLEKQTGNFANHWSFYIIEGYNEQAKRYLEKHLKQGQQHTRTVLVINGPLDKNTLKFLLLPINGIVSLSFLSLGYKEVIESLLKDAMFLQQELHKNLSKEVDFKKSYSKPIKQFVLNKNKITVELSDRDYQVLQLLLDGHSNSEIAVKMHFARSTVSTIISALLKKMNASDRTDATVKTIRNGWVDCYR
jgi:two-component system response regulator DegU